MPTPTHKKWPTAVWNSFKQKFENFFEKTDTYLTYFGTCSTVASTQIKLVSCTDFTLKTGARITIIFTHDNEAESPKLNINNTGAKFIYYKGDTIDPTLITGGTALDFIYDGTNYIVVGNLVPATSGGGGSNPTGTIITFMGVTAPEGYLICDGTEYNITDYPNLAAFMNTQFNMIDYFGGDGTVTFAVPDLRGEFLRGSGYSTTNMSGSGMNVGEHQDPTVHLGGYINKNLYYKLDYLEISGADAGLLLPDNADMTSTLTIQDPAVVYQISAGGTTQDEVERIVKYTSRPTNTSVLYCIKY